MRPLRGSSLTYIDEDLDEPGVGKLFPNEIERTLYLNYVCPRGDTNASVEAKRAIYSNPKIVDLLPNEDDPSLSSYQVTADF
jgi:hypothetical protein